MSNYSNEQNSWIYEIKPFYVIESYLYDWRLSTVSTVQESRHDISLRVVAVAGGLQRPSKSAALSKHLLDLIADEIPCQARMVEISAIAPQLAGALWRSQLPAAVEQALAAVEQADVLVVVTPVFRGSYTGLFKHFFDFIDQDALADKPVLLATTGGSERHALVIDHQLRPLFSFFQARTLPLGVYAADKDFANYRVQNEALIERAKLAVQRALPLLELTGHAKSAAVDEAVAL